MALAATTIVEVETGGSDTLNGGLFDPGQTAGMLADGAATVATSSAPVFSSGSYNFVAGDVSAWLYIASGTNWTAGWYQIASVASNAATLSAALGSGVLKGNTGLTTVAGCATVASPTSATWSIDYSQQAAAQFAYIDLASTGAGLTVSSTGFPFAKQQVGNSLVITGGTNFTAGRYVIASVAASVATVRGVANITTGAGASGTGGLGGALASPGTLAATLTIHSAQVEGLVAFTKGGTYTITSASTNIAGGCCAMPSASFAVVGYTSGRTRVNTDTKPIWKLNAALSSASMITTGRVSFYNLTFDGNAQTTSVHVTTGALVFLRCVIQNFTAASGTSQTIYANCYATGNSAAVFPCCAVACVATGNTATPFTTGPCVACVSYSNTGVSTNGFSLTALPAVHCVAYGNGRDGFVLNSSVAGLLQNCIAESNTGYAVDDSARAYVNSAAVALSAYNNTGGIFRSGTISSVQQINLIIPSASVFTNAAAGDFSLNTTANAGALVRAKGYPGVFPGGLTTGYPDVGAAQHADPASAGVQYRPSFSGNV